MINESLYNKTVDILVQAYFNDTLISGNQCGCAVGNIVAANCGIKIQKESHRIPGGSNHLYWNTPGMQSTDAPWYGYIRNNLVEGVKRDLGRKQIESTGYNLHEIHQIERAFEGVALYNDDTDETMFDRLMAVIAVLDEIHQNTDAAVTAASKQKFVKAV